MTLGRDVKFYVSLGVKSYVSLDEKTAIPPQTQDIVFPPRRNILRLCVILIVN
jgi:hypothetical protein